MNTPRLIFLVAVPALLALLLAGSAASRPVAEMNAIRITDATGDSGAAPDIRYVDVGNDVVKGPIVMWVETPNRASLAADDEVGLVLDTDLNGSTGQAGFDYIVAGDASETGALLRWDGSGFVQVPASTLEWDWYTSRWVRVSIQPADLGGTRGFNFVAYSANGESYDFAPDGAPASYSLRSGPIVLTFSGFAVRPKVARAGSRQTAVLVVTREDIADVLEVGTIGCAAVVAGKRIPVRKGWTDAGASCSYVIPRAAKGKALKVTLSVAYGGRMVSRTYTGKVR